MAKMIKPIGLKSVRVISVIETVAEVGYGTEADPVREATQYWDLDGNLLAEKDNDSEILKLEKLKKLTNSKFTNKEIICNLHQL